jgi:hypothetical protein
MSRLVRLDEAVRGRILSGALPPMTQLQLQTGAGYGETCVCCDERIGPTDIKYEVQYQSTGQSIALSMHLRCYGVWLNVAASIGDTVIPAGDSQLNYPSTPAARPTR